MDAGIANRVWEIEELLSLCPDWQKSITAARHEDALSADVGSGVGAVDKQCAAGGRDSRRSDGE
jgi:hypothetical protein